MSQNNGDTDDWDSNIMQLVKSSIHKNVDDMMMERQAPFQGGRPDCFSTKKSGTPTVVIVMSCRFFDSGHDDDDFTQRAKNIRERLRQRSVGMADRKNLLWDTTGPLQFQENSPCAQRLSDKKQILTIDAHGSTEIDLDEHHSGGKGHPTYSSWL